MNAVAPLEFDDQHSAAAIRGIVRRATLARRTPLAFFNFMWREELTQERVQALAFQRVYFKFIEQYKKCVVRMPPGFSKTTCAAALGLYLLGLDHTSRGAFVSATEAQAYKPLSQMRDAIEYADESFPELRVIYPDLKRSKRPNDPWSKSAFTVDRAAGIRDASVTAFGQDSVKLIGSRLAWIIVDDILSLQNTNTKSARDTLIKWFMQIVRDRLDAVDGRCVVTNVPYADGDLTFYLERPKSKRGPGWPTLQMDAFGNIKISNADDFDCEEIRPSTRSKDTYRLVDHDTKEHGAVLAVRNPASEWQWAEVGTKEAEKWAAAGGERRYMDLKEECPLWPQKFSAAVLAEKETDDEISQVAFDINYRMLTRAGSGKRCKEEWIKRCKELARQAGHSKQLDAWQPTAGSIVVMGVDIGGLGLQEDSDWSCLFVFELLMTVHHANGMILRPGMRRILRVIYGKWSPDDLADKIVEVAKPFGPAMVRVEINSERSLIAWVEERSGEIEITPHVTGNNKHHVAFGVEGSIFRAMQKGLWLIPNVDDECEPDVERWVQACRDYVPHEHTDDGLMAAWFACEEARSIWTPTPDDEKKN